MSVGSSPSSILKRSVAKWVEVVVGRPVRQGHLRLRGLDPPVRTATVFGLGVLVLLGANVLVTPWWRRAELIAVPSGVGADLYVPGPLIPLTLIGMAVAWILIGFGLTYSSLPVRIFGAFAFLFANNGFGNVIVASLRDTMPARLAPTTARVSYGAFAAIVVLGPPIARRIPILAGAIRTFVMLSVSGLFGSILWLHAEEVRGELVQSVPVFVSFALAEIQTLSFPVWYVALVLVAVGFSYEVADGSAAMVELWPRNVARFALGALLALKLWAVGFAASDRWRHTLEDNPQDFLFAAVAIGTFGLFAFLTRQLRRRDHPTEVTEENVVYGSALVLALPLLSVLVIVSAAGFLTNQLGLIGLSDWIRDYPAIRTYGPFAVAATFGLYGLYSLRAEATPRERDVGLAALLLFTWNLALQVGQHFGTPVGPSDWMLDLLITLIVALVTVSTWRRLEGRRAAVLIGLVVFSWLAVTKGEFLDLLGGAVGLAPFIVLVVGMAFTLIFDSHFTDGDSRGVSRQARPLLWIGYLAFSLSLLGWNVASHHPDTSSVQSEFGFYRLGIPLAVWLVLRQPFGERTHESRPGAEPNISSERAAWS